MSPLSKLAWSAVAFAGCWFLAYAAGRDCRRWLPRDDPERAAKRFQRLNWGLFAVLYILTVIAMTAAGWLDTTEHIAGAIPAVTDEVTMATLGFVVPGFVWTAPYLGMFPAIREARDVDMTTWDLAAKLFRYLFVTLAVAVLATAVLTVGWDYPPTWSQFALPICVGAVALYTAVPALVPLVSATRAPTDEERDRLEDATAAAGLSVRWIYVQRTRGGGIANVGVRGVPGWRVLVVSDHLLAEADDDVLAAMVAHSAGRAETYYVEVQGATVIGTALAALVPWLEPPLPIPVSDVAATGVALLAGGTAMWFVRRLVLRADAIAADRVGAERVADALDWLADVNDLPRTIAWWTSLRKMEPSIAMRLARLRERTAATSEQ